MNGYAFADFALLLFVKIPHLLDLIVGLKFLELVQLEGVSKLQ
jgi:hypothetical protein